MAVILFGESVEHRIELIQCGALYQCERWGIVVVMAGLDVLPEIGELPMAVLACAKYPARHRFRPFLALIEEERSSEHLDGVRRRRGRPPPAPARLRASIGARRAGRRGPAAVRPGADRRCVAGLPLGCPSSALSRLRRSPPRDSALCARSAPRRLAAAVFPALGRGCAVRDRLRLQSRPGRRPAASLRSRSTGDRSAVRRTSSRPRDLRCRRRGGPLEPGRTPSRASSRYGPSDQRVAGRRERRRRRGE
jgi:hypothetical protein